MYRILWWCRLWQVTCLGRLGPASGSCSPAISPRSRKLSHSCSMRYLRATVRLSSDADSLHDSLSLAVSLALPPSICHSLAHFSVAHWVCLSLTGSLSTVLLGAAVRQHTCAAMMSPGLNRCAPWPCVLILALPPPFAHVCSQTRTILSRVASVYLSLCGSPLCGSLGLSVSHWLSFYCVAWCCSKTVRMCS